MNIAIIGGGIGGLSTALALRQAGFKARIFEQAPALLDVGAAIAVWPNALRVLQQMGVGSEVLKHSGVIRQVSWLNWDGHVLKQLSLPETNAPAVALHRADLQRTLLQAEPEEFVHLGKRFESFRQDGPQIQASFADGTAVLCDVLIGADGLHSLARAQTLDDGPPVYRGYTVWRGLTTSTPRALTPDTAIELYGSGKRFGIGPVGHGRTGWWATANEPAGTAEDTSAHQQKLLSLFTGWYAPVLELIAATPTNSILRNAAYDRPPVNKWGERNMTLLGDAAHPTTPNLGQGGCMAIEDGAVLARCLSKYQETLPALRAYERVRAARTAALTRYSLRYGMLGQWESRRAVRLRSRLLSLIPEALCRRLLRLIFEYDAYAVSI